MRPYQWNTQPRYYTVVDLLSDTVPKMSAIHTKIVNTKRQRRRADRKLIYTYCDEWMALCKSLLSSTTTGDTDYVSTIKSMVTKYPPLGRAESSVVSLSCYVDHVSVIPRGLDKKIRVSFHLDTTPNSPDTEVFLWRAHPYMATHFKFY